MKLNVHRLLRIILFRSHLESFQTNSKYGRATELVANIEQKLLDRLKEDDKDLFKKYVDAQGETNQLTAVRNLVYGYKLGLIMTA